MDKVINDFYKRFAPLDATRIYTISESDEDTFYYLGGSYYYWPFGEEVICLADYVTVVPDCVLPTKLIAEGGLRDELTMLNALEWLYPKVEVLIKEKFVII